MSTDTREALAELPASQVATIIQEAWDDKAPDVIRFGLAVASRIEDAYAARAALATQPAQPSATPNNDEVICPSCAHQFRAIPVNVQRLMLDAGFEPPFTAQPSAQGEAVAWLVEWKAHGHGPQWWGFNHTPGKNATWCSDANNAIRFARKEDAERMRLHVIAVAGLTGMHSYERSVSVTEHMWIDTASAPAAPAQSSAQGEAVACGLMPLIEDYAKAVHDGDDAACVVLRRTIAASLAAAPVSAQYEEVGFFIRYSGRYATGGFVGEIQSHYGLNEGDKLYRVIK